MKFNSNFWVGMIVMVLMVIGLFFIARGIFTILSWVAPILFILTLILRYKVVVGYLNMLWDLLKQNPIVGVIAVILTVVGFPVVAFVLFAKAMLDRKVDQMSRAEREAVEGKLADYEILEDDQQDSFDLPQMEKKPKSSPYDRYFENES